MPKKREEIQEIKLNGRVIDWDHPAVGMRGIEESEIEKYEAQGETVTDFAGKWYVLVDDVPEDGTIQLQPKSDERGRLFSAGGHTNYGISGYFKGFVLLAGKRKVLTNFWALFPNQEHHFVAQQDKLKTFELIAERVAQLEGTVVAKVKGGFEIPGLAKEQSET